MTMKGQFIFLKIGNDALRPSQQLRSFCDIAGIFFFLNGTVQICTCQFCTRQNTHKFNDMKIKNHFYSHLRTMYDNSLRCDIDVATFTPQTMKK